MECAVVHHKKSSCHKYMEINGLPDLLYLDSLFSKFKVEKVQSLLRLCCVNFKIYYIYPKITEMDKLILLNLSDDRPGKGTAPVLLNFDFL